MMRRSLTPVLLPGVLFMLALLLTLYNFSHQLAPRQWAAALWHPVTDNVAQLIFHFSLLPRLALSLLVGAGLGLVGLLFQQVLRNPLAEPATLGVASGAQLGLSVVTLWSLPGGKMTQQLAAAGGALLAGIVVFAVAWSRRLSPVTLILAGLVLSLYCGAVNQLLAIFHHERLQSLFLWSSGSLNQQDWSTVRFLLPRLLTGFVLVMVLLRPLTLLGLDDSVAKNLGVRLVLVRVIVLGIAIIVSAMLVSAAGIVAFIALFSPLLAKLVGARRLPARLLLAPLLGALLLWLADQCAIWLTDRWHEVSTGTLTALIGAPLLLWLLPRLRTGAVPPALNQGDRVPSERQNVPMWGASAVAVLLLLVLVGLSLGRNAGGWLWASGELWQQLQPWRAPRLAAALSAGMMLGVAGCLVQRLTGNPMASPEVLGISSGAACGVIVMLFLIPGDASGWLLLAGSLGAALTLMLIMWVASRGHFSVQRMLLAGIATGTVFSTLLMMLLASGDPRLTQLLTWIAGSTYQVDVSQALHTAAVAAVLLLLAPLTCRWLTILPLGAVAARGVGIALTPVRISLLLLAAALTAAATLTTGPLSFTGLMAPHMARMLGFRRAGPQLFMAALLGGGLMVVADWCGRVLAFPSQIPAGLLATFIGAPWFIWLLRKVE